MLDYWSNKIDKTIAIDIPSIYVGTYEKYNNGSLAGNWLKLTDYDDLDDFYKACHELHKDESDPELMFQDYEYIPKSMIGESWIDPQFYDFIDTVDFSCIDLDVYIEAVNNGLDWNDLESKYYGEFDSDSDFTFEYAINTGFEQPNNFPYNYIDWDMAAYDLMQSFTEINGHYFSDN